MNEDKPTYTLVSSPQVETPDFNTINVFGDKVKVPNPPQKNCKKCFGRGFVGIIKDTKTVILCSKCYPKFYKGSYGLR